MIALVIVFASVTAYLLIGWLIMQWDMPALWVRAHKAHVEGHSFPEIWEGYARTHVHSGAATTFLLWPFRLPFLFAMAAADRHDPKRIEAEMRQQQQRIAELERELRIGRSS